MVKSALWAHSPVMVTLTLPQRRCVGLRFLLHNHHHPTSAHPNPCLCLLSSLSFIMARFCGLCNRSFPTQRGFMHHNSAYHRHPKPRLQQTTVRYHPHLNGMSYFRLIDASEKSL